MQLYMAEFLPYSISVCPTPHTASGPIFNLCYFHFLPFACRLQRPDKNMIFSMKTRIIIKKPNSCQSREILATAAGCKSRYHWTVPSNGDLVLQSLKGKVLKRKKRHDYLKNKISSSYPGCSDLRQRLFSTFRDCQLMIPGIEATSFCTFVHCPCVALPSNSYSNWSGWGPNDRRAFSRLWLQLRWPCFGKGT